MRLRSALFWALSPALFAACSGDDRDLGSNATSTTSSTAVSSSSVSSSASTGSGGAGSTSTSTTSSSATTTSTGAGGSVNLPAKVTVVHGVNDSNAIRLCFQAYPDNANGSDPPWPDDPAGLPFAGGLVVAPNSGVIPEGSDVRIHVLSGDLSLAAGKTCDEALALGDPAAATGLLATPLAVLSASVFTSGKSLLVVPQGCAEAGHADGYEKLACGQTYTSLAPNLGMVALAMSLDSNAAAIGFQTVHAAPGMYFAVDFRFTPGFDGVPEEPIGSNVAVGGISPQTPYYGITQAEMGVASTAKMNTYYPNDVNATSSVTLSTILANAGLQVNELKDGKTYVFVAVGMYPGIVGSSWWHQLTYTLVEADPQ